VAHWLSVLSVCLATVTLAATIGWVFREQLWNSVFQTMLEKSLAQGGYPTLFSDVDAVYPIDVAFTKRDLEDENDRALAKASLVQPVSTSTATPAAALPAKPPLVRDILIYADPAIHDISLFLEAGKNTSDGFLFQVKVNGTALRDGKRSNLFKNGTSLDITEQTATNISSPGGGDASSNQGYASGLVLIQIQAQAKSLEDASIIDEYGTLASLQGWVLVKRRRPPE
jgi:hypothetical protein